jgi:hypothetical protein
MEKQILYATLIVCGIGYFITGDIDFTQWDEDMKCVLATLWCFYVFSAAVINSEND